MPGAANIFFNLIDSCENLLTGSLVELRPYNPPFLTGSFTTYGGPVKAFTDNSGSVTFNNVVAGLYKVTYTNSGFATEQQTNTLNNYAKTVFYINVLQSLSGSTVNGNTLIVNSVPSGSNYPFNVISASWAAYAVTATSASYFSGSISNAVTANSASTAISSSYSNFSKTASYVTDNTGDYISLIPATGIIINDNVQDYIHLSSGSIIISDSNSDVITFNSNIGSINISSDNGAGINLSESSSIYDEFGDSIILNNGKIQFTGSVSSKNGFTGSLQGTASNAISSSYTVTSSAANSITFVPNLANTASYVLNAVSASYTVPQTSASWASASLTSISSSYSNTSSYAVTSSAATSITFIPNSANTASYVLNAISASFVTPQTSGSWASASIFSISSSFASQSLSSSYLNGNATASLFGTASNSVSSSYTVTSSFSSVSISSSFANTSIFTTSASYASSSLTASYIATASYSNNSLSSSYAVTASYLSGSISNATTASYALNAGNSITSSHAIYSETSNTANYATNANLANTASYFSGSISNAISSSYASTASFALNGGGSGTILTTGSTYQITSSWANNSKTASYLSDNLGDYIQLAIGSANDVNIQGKYGDNIIIDSGSITITDVIGDFIELNKGRISIAALTVDMSGEAVDLQSSIVDITGGKLTSPNTTGSLFGTASYSLNSITSSYLTGWNFTNTSSVVNVTASNVIVEQSSTASYRAVWFDYYASSGSNIRAGTIYGTWYSSSISYAEYSTVDIGITNQVTLSLNITNSFIQLLANANLTPTWTISSLGRFL